MNPRAIFSFLVDFLVESSL